MTSDDEAPASVELAAGPAILPPVTAAAPAVPGAIARKFFDDLVEQWHRDHRRSGPLVRDTATMNAFFHAKENLKQRLAALFKET
jgi:hypothetical protein